MGVVPRKAAKLEKVGWNKKNSTFAIYSRKTGKSWDQTFCTGTCPGIVLVKKGIWNFHSGPLTCNHAYIFPRKAQKVQKVILFFIGRGEEIRPCRWHIWIPWWLNLIWLLTYFFRFLVIFRGKNGVNVRPNVQTLGVSRFCKNLNFSKILETLFVSPWILPLVKIWQKSCDIWGNPPFPLSPLPPEMAHFMDAASPQKHWKIYNLTTTNAIKMKFTTITYIHDTFSFGNILGRGS